MRILQALLAAILLVLPSGTQTDASPDTTPNAHQLTDGLTASGAAIPTRDAFEPQWSAPQSLSAADLQTVRWAIGRFLLIGLQVPDVEIAFHPSSEDCGWNEGRYRSDGETRRIDVCVPDHGTFHSELQRRRTVVHELAHAWDDVNLTDVDRDALLSVLGAHDWYGSNLDWRARGVERFAETIVWGLYDQRRRPTKIEVPCADLHQAFVEITGHEPLGPIEAVCDLTRQPAARTPTVLWAEYPRPNSHRRREAQSDQQVQEMTDP